MTATTTKTSQTTESNANSKGALKDTFQDSVTWQEVSCVHCREQFSKRSFNAPFHIEACETMWTLKQQRIAKNMYRTHRNYCTVRCVRCGIDVYSDRKCSYRVCFKCRHLNQLDAVRRCQARYKAKHEDRVCECCQKAYSPKRSTAKYCSDKCRVQSHRLRLGELDELRFVLAEVQR